MNPAPLLFALFAVLVSFFIALSCKPAYKSPHESSTTTLAESGEPMQGSSPTSTSEPGPKDGSSQGMAANGAGEAAATGTTGAGDSQAGSQTPPRGSGKSDTAVLQGSPARISDKNSSLQRKKSTGTSIVPEYHNGAPKSLPGTRNKAPRKGSGTIIIVIDDAGHNLRELESFLDLPFPITIAVLPGLPHSGEAAQKVRAAGKELILHQPMQARGGENPGPGAIMKGMDPSRVQELLLENLKTVPGATGVNNHMGSATTEDEKVMTVVMELVKVKGLYYLDSLTTSGSVTRTVSDRINLRHWERDVFLDNTQDKSSILRALEEGKRTAASGGVAVMIGHVWSDDLAKTLMEYYPTLVEQGYSLSTIAKVMMQGESPDSEPDFDEDTGN